MKFMHSFETKIQSKSNDFNHAFDISMGNETEGVFSFNRERHFHFVGKHIPLEVEVSKKTVME